MNTTLQGKQHIKVETSPIENCERYIFMHLMSTRTLFIVLSWTKNSTACDNID